MILRHVYTRVLFHLVAASPRGHHGFLGYTSESPIHLSSYLTSPKSLTLLIELSCSLKISPHLTLFWALQRLSVFHFLVPFLILYIGHFILHVFLCLLVHIHSFILPVILFFSRSVLPVQTFLWTPDPFLATSRTFLLVSPADISNSACPSLNYVPLQNLLILLYFIYQLISPTITHDKKHGDTDWFLPSNNQISYRYLAYASHCHET